MVSAEDVAVDSEYKELVAEIREELERYGTLLSLRVPREPHAGPEFRGEFLVHADFAGTHEAAKAAAAVAGRIFAGKTVLVVYGRG